MSSVPTLPAQRVGIVARAMLNGTLHYLLGALELEQLRHEVGAYENDPDFLPFIAIKMDIEQMSISPQMLKKTNNQSAQDVQKITESTQWAKAISLQQCATLAERFSN
ncbi:hypothetical protein ACFOND_10485 [Reinekea marina]|uniref:DUF2489 domain-containing protein n=2 Tax=Reinekea marina TaxID=1310421 RepID=A0ABV7WUQ0_9GAMM